MKFQDRVTKWMLACFGPEIAADTVERNYRFLEEALELAQSLDCSKDDALRLVDYVYGRQRGASWQEVGGVMVTLAALCEAHGLDLARCGDIELRRISEPQMIEKIRRKHAAKNIRSGPLPGQPDDGWIEHTIPAGMLMTPDEIHEIFTERGFVFVSKCPFVLQEPNEIIRNADGSTTFRQRKPVQPKE